MIFSYFSKARSVATFWFWKEVNCTRNFFFLFCQNALEKNILPPLFELSVWRWTQTQKQCSLDLAWNSLHMTNIQYLAKSFLLPSFGIWHVKIPDLNETQGFPLNMNPANNILPQLETGDDTVPDAASKPAVNSLSSSPSPRMFKF